jgi:hypothetical protein
MNVKIFFGKFLNRLSSVLPSALGHFLFRHWVWEIEDGVGKGLKFSTPYNFSYVLGTNELPVQNEISRILHKGEVFFDIGANVGFFSIMAARIVGEKGKVYAFEPVMENLISFQKNVELNKFGNVEIITKAVS